MARMSDTHTPTDAEVAAWAMDHLQQVVRIDSASDERSTSVPSTPGQTALADHLAAFFGALGATVDRDDFANIIATFPGAGRGVDQAPVALMVHLDTAPGTEAESALNVVKGWTGDRIPYPRNSRLRADTETYPALSEFLGQDVVFGAGQAPFGLDDKLGLTHLMTLARLIAADPTGDRPPVMLIGRPDEEIGREEALIGLASTLAERKVDFGYTVDGILPFEVNVENFNAAQASLRFPASPLPAAPGAETARVEVFLGGVNTHGATAKAEGHRAATRLGWEIVQALRADGWGRQILPVRFACDPRRDCDATAVFRVGDGPKGELAEAFEALATTVEDVVGPHLRRGASWRMGAPGPDEGAGDGSALAALDFVGAFLGSAPGWPLLAEDADGREGYSHPYRIEPVDGGLRLDIRLRDFTVDGLEARKAHVAGLVPKGVSAAVNDQYGNMGLLLAARPELVELPKQAALAVGAEPRVLPIRGGTGVDPFLDAGVLVANLGTGYFAPESEKEITSLQLMAGHARWLHALLGVIARSR